MFEKSGLRVIPVLWLDDYKWTWSSRSSLLSPMARNNSSRSLHLAGQADASRKTRWVCVTPEGKNAREEYRCPLAAR